MSKLSEKIQKEVEALAVKIADAQERLQAALCDEHNIHVGDIVIITRGKKKGKRAVVDGIDFSLGLDIYGRPWLQGRVEKNDGGWHKESQHLYTDWRKQ
jgi:hypothetical protein